jgi:hypothetical protein
MSHLLLREWWGEVLEKDAAPNQIRKAIGTTTDRLLTVLLLVVYFIVIQISFRILNGNGRPIRIVLELSSSFVSTLVLFK